MIPLHQAYEVRQAVLEYIKATFRFKEQKANDAFYRFIEDKKDGLFKGPYISLKTPFVKAGAEENIPLDIKPTFLPHLHQVQAFRRLTTHDGHKPQSTLLTTGTGSGKTECFLYPLLDYICNCSRVARVIFRNSGFNLTNKISANICRFGINSTTNTRKKCLR